MRRRACLIRPTGRNMPIVTVALDRLATSFADRVFQRCYGLLLRRGCAGHVENFFLQNCAVQIVRAVTERDLREGESQAYPIGSQVVDVVQVNSAHREIAKLVKCGGAFDVGKDSAGLGRLESERNKTGKAAGLILQLTQLAQMIGAVSERLDVTVKHRARAATAH